MITVFDDDGWSSAVVSVLYGGVSTRERKPQVHAYLI